MIVPMKKLNLLLFHKEKEQFLNSLQELGVVHIEMSQQAESETLTAVQDKVKAADRVLKALKRSVSGKKKAQEKKDNAWEIIKSYDELIAQQEKLEQQMINLKNDALLLEPWGNFDPSSVKRLRDSGVFMRFFKLPEKTFSSIDKENLNIEIINRSDDDVYFISLESKESALKEFEETILQQASLEQTLDAIEDLKAKQSDIVHKIEEYSKYQDILSLYISKLNSNYSLESARLGMEETAGGKIYSLTGWLPAKTEKKVSEFLEKYSAWYEIRKPEKDDIVPVMLKNGPFSRLFEPILKLYGIPDNTDIDSTRFFAPFFTLFVGLCIGDIAYGAIMLIASIAAFFALSKKWKSIGVICIILSFMTIFCGALLNSFFGETFFGKAGQAPGAAILPYGEEYFAPFTPVMKDGLTVYPMMSFALLVGFLQVMLAYILNTINKFSTGGFKGGMPPLSFIFMFFGSIVLVAHTNFLDLNLAKFTVVNFKAGAILLTIPKIAGTILVWSGLALFVLFANSDKKLGGRIGQSFLDFYNTATGIIGNILSYLRLFALGLAGGMLGSTYNMLALKILRDNDGNIQWVNPLIVGTVIILVVGHGLNLFFAIVGAFVHPLRLTFVEFLQNCNFKWGGKPYKPLAHAAKDE